MTHGCKLVSVVMFWNSQNSVCLAVVQRSPGPQGAAAREAEYVTEERAGQTQVTLGTHIRRGKHTQQSSACLPGDTH